MTQDEIGRSTAEGIHLIADMPGEDSYFADLSAEDLSVWVCGVCPLDDCDWTGELVTEERDALRELTAHLQDTHGLSPRKEIPDGGGNEGSCPACGSGRIEHHEDVVARRHFRGVRDDGVLVFDSLTDSFDDDGVRERLWCGDCSHEFAVPEEVDFV